MKLRIDVWSDVACPWCYVGKRRLESAIARFEHGGAVEVVWRAFELDPTAPRVRGRGVSDAERLAKKYGMPVAQAELMMRKMTDVAAAERLEFHLERIQSGNTFDAHRVIHIGAEHGKQDAIKERLFRAYLTEGEAIGEPEVLVRLAGEAGLGEDEVRAMLAGDACKKEVRADEAEAQALGVNGVPFFVIARRYGVSGAQSPDVLLGALTRAWAAESEAPVKEGTVCGPSGCA